MPTLTDTFPFRVSNEETRFRDPLAVNGPWMRPATLPVSSGITTEWKIGAFAWILVRKLARNVPGGLSMLWLAVAAVFLGGYLLSWRFFRRVEAPIKRSGPDFKP